MTERDRRRAELRIKESEVNIMRFQCQIDEQLEKIEKFNDNIKRIEENIKLQENEIIKFNKILQGGK